MIYKFCLRKDIQSNQIGKQRREIFVNPQLHSSLGSRHNFADE